MSVYVNKKPNGRFIPETEESVATKGDQTRERILTEAARLVERKGFRATSLSDLLKESGIKKGNLYFHFHGKDDLGIAVLERARDNFIEFLDSALTGETAGERLSNFFVAVLEKHLSKGFVGG
jgi:TetR/AcrR family transcriptional repressor of nem operon